MRSSCGEGEQEYGGKDQSKRHGALSTETAETDKPSPNKGTRDTAGDDNEVVAICDANTAASGLGTFRGEVLGKKIAVQRRGKANHSPDQTDEREAEG